MGRSPDFGSRRVRPTPASVPDDGVDARPWNRRVRAGRTGHDSNATLAAYESYARDCGIRTHSRARVIVAAVFTMIYLPARVIRPTS